MKISSPTALAKNTTKLWLHAVTLSTSLFSSNPPVSCWSVCSIQALPWWEWGRSHQGTREHVKVQRNWESRVFVHQLLGSSAAQEPTSAHSHPGVDTHPWDFCLRWLQKASKTYVVVVIEALLDHVELSVLSGIVSYTCAVQPVAVVTADIMIHLQGEKSQSWNMAACKKNDE